MEEHLCLYCEKKLVGRADKKYCNDYCRTAYNNKSRGAINNTVRNINNKLKRNRNILEAILKGEQSKKCHMDMLTKEGFLFDFHTNTLQNKKGDTYFFCYEYGYLQTGESWFLVVKSKEFN